MLPKAGPYPVSRFSVADYPANEYNGSIKGGGVQEWPSSRISCSGVSKRTDEKDDPRTYRCSHSLFRSCFSGSDSLDP